MITARHENGKVVITTDDWDEMGDAIKTARYIDMEDAQRLHKELNESLFGCREYIVNTLPSSVMAPHWVEEIDDMDNSTWEAASPYEVDESPLQWRLKLRIGNNELEWYECHDLELMDEDSPQGWPTLEQAKAAIAEKHLEIIKAEGLAK